MSSVTTQTKLPTHLDLPDSDGDNVINDFERPQTELLVHALEPYLLQTIHPDGRFLLCGDVGVYWRLTTPPLDGCKCPDLMYVPNVPRMLDGHYRRSYVMWQEHQTPVFLAEFVSSPDGVEEHDTTPFTGKFWVYEQGIRAQYYAIFDPDSAHLEAYELVAGRFRPILPNSRGHFPLPSMGLELGRWHGVVRMVEATYIRFFSDSGTMLPTIEESARLGFERAEAAQSENEELRKDNRREKRRANAAERQAEEAARRAEEERNRADRYREMLERLGIQVDGENSK